MISVETLKRTYMVRTRPVSNTKTFNVHYVKSLSKNGAIKIVEPLLDNEEIIDVLEPGEEAYGMTKEDIKAFFKKKEPENIYYSFKK